MKVYIKTELGNRLIGKFEDGVFTSHRQSSKHLYKKLNAWGIDCKVYDGLLADRGLHTVRIVDSDTKTIYGTDADNFKKYGTILHHKPHRPQVFLPLQYWSETSKEYKLER
jgi:hypothetical protein